MWSACKWTLYTPTGKLIPVFWYIVEYAKNQTHEGRGVGGSFPFCAADADSWVSSKKFVEYAQ